MDWQFLRVYRGLSKQASRNFRYNFDEFHGLLIGEDTFNRVFDGTLTVSKFFMQSIPYKQIHVFFNMS